MLSKHGQLISPRLTSHTIQPFNVVPFCTAVVPPGYQILSGVLTKCPAGSFRAAWKPAGDAGSCIACGDGVKADATDRFTLYDIVTNVATQMNITSSTDDCCKYHRLKFVGNPCARLSQIQSPLMMSTFTSPALA